MRRTVFGIAIAALTIVGVSGIAQAAPIAPLPAGVAADHGSLTQVQYWHHRYWHRCGWWHGYRRCW